MKSVSRRYLIAKLENRKLRGDSFQVVPRSAGKEHRLAGTEIV